MISTHSACNPQVPVEYLLLTLEALLGLGVGVGGGGGGMRFKHEAQLLSFTYTLACQESDG